MATENRQKIKLLLMLELLRSETDPNHPISTKQLCDTLVSKGITCDRKTLTRDIKTLNDFGFEVMTTHIGHENAYYVDNRSFTVPELKILIDAVQAASFITQEKSSALIGKLAALGGKNSAEILQKNMVCFNTRKHTNTEIYYIVEALEQALLEKKKASFFYFDRDENGSKVYRKNKGRYVVEPMALVFSEDNYYLMCFDRKHDSIANYRTDRMEHVCVEKAPVGPEAILEKRDVSDYTEQVFKMYGGPSEPITLQFQDSLIGVVQDKFGEDVKITRLDESTCTAEVQVQISPTFWGWLFQFVGRMQIVDPQSVEQAYADRMINGMQNSQKSTQGQKASH